MNKQFDTICNECGYNLLFNRDDIESLNNNRYPYAVRCRSCGKYTPITLHDLCNVLTMNEEESGCYEADQKLIKLHNLIIEVIAGKIGNDDLIKTLKVIYKELKSHFDECDHDDSWYDDRINLNL